ncbi:MAG TPA: DUF2520 domain-containing protein [Gemmatimonadaceae bacterium]
MSDRIFVLGAGRAGRGLARALRASGVEVVGVHGRHEPGGEDGVTVGAIPPALARASVALVTVRDAQIDGALDELLAAGLAPGTVVLHASGSAEPAALARVRAAGHPSGTFHPLVPIADPARAPEMLRGAWIGIDGDAAARDAAIRLAERLGAHPLDIPPGEKARYHAAAVMVSNFPVVLLYLGERLLVEAGLDPRVAHRALHPLFSAMADNLRVHRGPRALTGPLVRGDADTVRRHLVALASDPEALAAYRALSRAALPLAVEAGAEGEKVEEIREVLG